MTSERERAFSKLLEATPPGWFVGSPSYHVERTEWALYAFDTKEKAHIGPTGHDVLIVSRSCGMDRALVWPRRYISTEHGGHTEVPHSSGVL